MAEGDLPLVVAYVELNEGPLMMTNLVDRNPEDILIGDRVTVQFIKTEKKGIAIPVFAPTD